MIIMKKKIKMRLKWLRTHIPKCARHTHIKKSKITDTKKEKHRNKL